MSTPTLVAVFLVAAAVWWWPSPRWWLLRVIDPAGAERWNTLETHGTHSRNDPFAVAASFDQLAVCLGAGLPVASAVEIVARTAPPGLGEPLSATAELLALGADAEHAWRRFAPRYASGRSTRTDDLDAERFEALAVLARRSARSGSSLSRGLAELAETTRRQADNDALAAAERAGVKISGPLGLCFLPAFVCLGIVPVVIGLAGTVLGR
ncbi:type II secretion system F family protein [Gordonia rhizosphera]|uniref:Type II secretion system protein GspF domain-containing protein n=1 Tax=Gordonia rhizosphera NBRC 16068 TaxID=1108045 RepID=K6WR54_9ACTN|nr:type II secretion system F family protein [Gordonia rhizosphera]GAB89039.1 hypothetical protein GORHZ_048_00160 [Gordonia rhizosphera NBRC 16068]